MPVELHSGMECLTSIDGAGHMRLISKHGGSVGYVVEDDDFALLLDTKRELAREGDGGGLLALIITALTCLGLTGFVLYGTWQHGRAYGVSEASFDHR
jgi:hypothetical protein